LFSFKERKEPNELKQKKTKEKQKIKKLSLLFQKKGSFVLQI